MSKQDEMTPIMPYEATCRHFYMVIFVSISRHFTHPILSTYSQELLNVEELVMTRIMSRRQNKRKTEKTGKVKRAVSKGKWEAAKKAAREAAEE